VNSPKKSFRLDSGNRDGRIVERLEVGHRDAAPFYRASMAQHMAIQRRPAPPSIEIPG
jgi:hypothetical protein